MARRISSPLGRYDTDMCGDKVFLLTAFVTIWSAVFVSQSLAQISPSYLNENEILKVNEGVAVPFGRSVYIDPEKDLKISVQPGHRCLVIVLDTDALSQRPGKLMPPVFPCQFAEREVRYTHFGMRSPSEDRVRLQIRYDSSAETMIIPFTIDVDVTFVQLEIVTRNMPIIVEQLMGISTPIDNRALEFTYDQETQVCKVSLLSGATGLPRYGRIMNDTSSLSMVDCIEFLTLGIRYKHTAPTNSPNRDYIPMVAEVMDRDGTVVKEEYFQMMVRIRGGSENTRPYPSFNSLLVMEVDQFVMTAITPDILWAEDIETPAGQLVFNITQKLGFGEGVLVSTDDRNQPVSSFYQKDVSDLKIAYKPPSTDSNSQRIFQIEFQIVDAEGLTSDPFTLMVVVNPMNTLAPVVTLNTGVQLFEGEARPLLSSQSLEISDEDNLEDVRLSIIDGLRHGQLLVSSVQRKFFTPADLDAGLVVYKHDGSDTYSDNIIFRMTDGKHEVEFLFPVTVYPQDDEPPVVIANTGLDIRKGQLAEISPFVLSATDIDSDDSSVKFVLQKPFSTEGEFVKRQFEVPHDPQTWEYNNGVYEKVVTEFLQEDIIEGKVFYRHVGPHRSDFTLDRVQFKVTDGHDPPNESPVHEFIVKIAPVDDQPPYLHPNTPLEMTVEEFQLTDFRRKFLKFSDDDTDNRKLRYTVEAPPFDTDLNTPLPAGKIVLCEDTETEVGVFTQAQVNHHKICYLPPSKELGITPRVIQFLFTVEDTSGNILPDQLFTIYLQPVDNKPPSVTNTGLTVFENGYMVIAPEMMDAQDPDTDLTQLKFKLMEGPEHGQLQKNGQPLEDGQFFYRDDISNGLLAYINTGKEMDKDAFSIDVSDGVHHVPFKFKVKVRSIDDEAPTLKSNEPGVWGAGLEVAEGQATTVTTAHLQASDPDTEELMLTFIVEKGPHEGIILRNGHPSDRFTQRDIVDGLVQYHHTGGEIGKQTKTDTFVLMLTDMSDDWVVGGNKIKNVEMSVDVLPVDSIAPTVDVVGQLEVNESEKCPILPKHLLIEDPDTDIDDVMCTIIVQPTKGYLENVAPAPGSEKPRIGMPITSFTMKDVHQNSINYVQSVHKGVEPRHDQFNIKCSDGKNFSPSKFFPVRIQPLNDEAPDVFMREFMVMEGMNLIIDLPILNAVDKDEPDDVLTFIINKPPKHGKIVQQTPSGIYPVTNFTLDSIKGASTIVYEHDDTETKSDSFNFTLTDGKHNKTEGIFIMILPVDDETPRLTINNGLEIDNIGDTKFISNKDLKATDLDSLDSALSFIVRRPPMHGCLQIMRNDIARNLTLGSNFTQGDIDTGRIRYIHTGAEGVRDLIKFDISDGTNPLIDRYFYVSVEGIDMTFPEVINKGVELPEAGRVTLSTDLLSGTDLDSPDQNLQFTITRAPSRGHLELTDMVGVPITTFTQLQLAGNKVRYVHTSEDEMKMDSFEFEVTDGYNPVFRTFRISLSDVDNKKPVLFFETLRVKEGSNKLITPFELKADDKDTPDDKIAFSVTQVPVHGNLLYNFTRIVMSFTLDDLNENLISYQHDGSETLTDSFSFTVTDGTHLDFYVFPRMTASTHKPQMMVIEILPVDNGVPMISVNKGASSLSPLHDGRLGFHITNKALRTDDRDSPVDDLLYSITSEPDYGYIINSAVGNTRVTNWTQAHIDRMQIYYILKDGMNETSDSFFFKITDKGGNVLSNQPFHLNWAWISLEADQFLANETSDKLEVTLQRRGYLGETCFVTVVVENDTALVGDDINRRYAHQVQFNPGQTEKTWYMYLQDDARFEGLEKLKLRLSDPVMAVLESPLVSTVTIQDEEDESTVYIPDGEYKVEENVGEVFIPVRRSGDVSDELMVICSTVEGSATGTIPNIVTSFSDYITRPEDFRNVVRFDKNETEKTCRVTIIDDSLFEDDETFSVVLTQPMGGRLGNFNSTQIIIAADKDDEPAFYFGDEEYIIDESEGFLEVKVWRSGTDLSKASSVTVRSRRTDPVSAQAGLDYVAVNRILDFAPGVTMQTVRVTILDDLGRPLVEGEETFELILRMPTAAMLGEPSKALVTINDTQTDIPKMSFRDAEYHIVENDQLVKAYIIRTGDLSHTSTVRCYTRQATAHVTDDFGERPDTNVSVIIFYPGEREKVCIARVVDDGLFEEEEKFKLVLGSPESLAPGGAVVGDLNVTDIKIKDGGDKPIIRFEESKYSINEPMFPEETAKIKIPIIRKGDLSKTSIVRVHTKDGSARAGQDYNGISQELEFNKDEARHIIEVEILYDGKKEMREAFTVHIKPDRNMIAETRSKNKVIVYIEEMDKLADVTFPMRPMVMSLREYDIADEENLPRPIQGYPVICITPCNPKHPDFSKTGSLCEKEGINDTLTRFRWRTSAPSGLDGVTSDLQDVESRTFFTTTHGITLDSIYFGGGSRVVCGARAVNTDGDPGLEILSDPISVSTDEGLCMPRVMDSVGAEPFTAKLKYTGPDDLDHPNKVRVSLLIPHRDGMLPVISTRQLSNFELALSPDGFRVGQHSCSNLLDYHEVPTQFGFITNQTKDPNMMGEMEPYQYSSDLRTDPTLRFYRNLDLEACLWSFESYYDMSELVQKCGAKITTDGQVRDLVQSYVSMTVPLYVSYVMHSPVATGGWQNSDLESALRLTFVYDTAILWQDGIQSPESSELQGYLYPTSMKVQDDGRLAVNFKSKARFRGQFIPAHPEGGLESMIMSASHPDLTFDLNLLRSEPTFEQPEQQWQFTSDYAARDYSGTYTIKLIPCTSPDQTYSLPLNCNPREPVTFDLPIRFQQVSDPVGTEFSLNTDFHLMRTRDLWLSDGSLGFAEESDASFLPDDEVLGRINVDPVQSLGDAFNLNIEKVFLCTGNDGYIPKYDPENEEYGCVALTPNLQHSFKVLDKGAPSTVLRDFRDIPFNARMAIDDEGASDLVKQPGADGFSLSAKPLFGVDQGRQWFVHCIYTVRSKKNSQRGIGKRSVDQLVHDVAEVNRVRRALDDVNGIGNSGRGTNMARLSLNYAGLEGSDDEGDVDIGTNTEDKESKPVLTPVLIALVILMAIVLLLAMLLVRRRRKRSTPPPSPTNTITVIGKGGKTRVLSVGNGNIDPDNTEV